MSVGVETGCITSPLLTSGKLYVDCSLFFLMIIRDFFVCLVGLGVFVGFFFGGGPSWVFAVALGLSRWGTEVAPGMWHLSSPIRDQTHLSCIGRQIVNYWPTREVPGLYLKFGFLIIA